MSASPINLRTTVPAAEASGNSALVRRRDAVDVALSANARGSAANPAASSAERYARGADSIEPRNYRRRDALVNALLAQVPAGDRAAAKIAIPAILQAARDSGSTDPNRVAYFLATAQTESDFGAHMTEVGHSKQWFNHAYGGEDGNRPGTDDGFRYRGRGYVQTTHAGRYAELSHKLGLPDVRTHQGSDRTVQPALLARPDELVQPRLAAKALVVGVQDNLFTHNRKAALDTTIPIGKKPGAVDFYHARAIVNGIVHSQATAVARHATEYARILDGYRHSVLGAPDTK